MARHPWRDAALLAASAGVAALAALTDDIPLQRSWGGVAVVPYAAGAVVAAVLAALSRRIDARTVRLLRAAIAVAVFAGAALLPLALNVRARAIGSWPYAQSETLLVEEGAAALLRGEDPYATTYEDTALGRWPPSAWRHLPYLAGILAFGVPAAVAGDSPLTDPRVWFTVVAVGAGVAAVALSRASFDRSVTVLIVLLALPTGARYLAGGGNDVAVLALMLLSLVLSGRGAPISAGLTAGAAAAIKQAAWPLLPFLVATARDAAGRPARARAALSAAGVVLVALTPFAVWDARALIDDTVLYPLGLARHPTLAGEATLGALVSRAFPQARLPFLAAAAAIVLGVTAALLFARPPRDIAGAAWRAAAVAAVAIAVSTAGRPGYLIYPLELALWSAVLLRDRFLAHTDSVAARDRRAS